MAFCTHCGTQMQQGRFCPGCGTPAGHGPSASPAPVPPAPSTTQQASTLHLPTTPPLAMTPPLVTTPTQVSEPPEGLAHLPPPGVSVAPPRHRTRGVLAGVAVGGLCAVAVAVPWTLLRGSGEDLTLDTVLATNPIALEGELSGSIPGGPCPDGGTILATDLVGEADPKTNVVMSIDAPTGAVRSRSEITTVSTVLVGCRDQSSAILYHWPNTGDQLLETAGVDVLSLTDGSTSARVEVDVTLQWLGAYDAAKDQYSFAGVDGEGRPALGHVDLAAGTSWTLPVDDVGWLSFVTITQDGSRAYVGFAQGHPAHSRDAGALSDAAKQAAFKGGYLEVDLGSHQVVARHDLPAIPIDASVSPDGQRLFVSYAWALNSAAVVSADTGEVEGTMSVANPGRPTFSADGRYVYLQTHYEEGDPDPARTIETIDVDRREVVASVPAGGWAVVLAEDGTRGYTLADEPARLLVLGHAG